MTDQPTLDGDFKWSSHVAATAQALRREAKEIYCLPLSTRWMSYAYAHTATCRTYYARTGHTLTPVRAGRLTREAMATLVGDRYYEADPDCLATEKKAMRYLPPARTRKIRFDS